MAAPDLQAGMKGLWRGRHVRVIELPAGDIVVVIDEHSDEVLQIPLHELELPKPSTEEDSPLAKFPALEWDIAEQRATAARKILATDAGSRTHVLKEEAQRLGISQRMLWRIVLQMKETGRVSALLSRARGRRAGCRTLGEDRERVIAQCLDEHYFKREKPSLAHLKMHVDAACRQEGLDLVSKKALRARIEAYGKLRGAQRREGGKKAREKHGPAPGHFVVEKPLSCVQIDHTLVDIMLVSDDEFRQPLGRPWLTVAVDVHTRVVLGFSISLDAPSSLSVALCMTHALLPKTGWLASLGIKTDWPHGKPLSVHLDNAREFHGSALQRGCAELGINISYRPVGRPHYGGAVERLIGTLMGFCHVLPGTTQSNVVQRGNYKSEERAVMTLSEFTAWFAMQVATHYHLKPHRGLLGVPPLLAWQKANMSDSDLSASMPAATALETLVTFLPAETRKIRRTGIEMNSVHYWASELATFINDEKNHLVSYDPRDVTRVYVRGPNGVLVEATATDARVPRVSLAEWKQMRARIRKCGTTPELLALRDEGLVQSKDIVSRAAKATRAARRAERNKEGIKAVDAISPKARCAPKKLDSLAIDYSIPVKHLDVVE